MTAAPALRRLFSNALPAVLFAAVAIALALPATPVAADEGQPEAGVAWRLEQPSPPPPAAGVQGSSIPIPLGEVGDLEFEAPNRGLLITPGNGNTIAPGLWAYNGREWHQLSTVCGAVEGRITWAAAEEFWTVSDGRPGQAADPTTGQPAPLEDRTLCHFAHGEVVGSYASPAFEVSSYQPMHALACLSPSDCWFGGDSLPLPEQGEAFHLHWDGASLSAEPTPWGHSVQDMVAMPGEGRLLESVRLAPQDIDDELEVPFPFALHTINPSGVTPAIESLRGVSLYGSEEFPQALDFLHLGADEEGVWAAAGPARETPVGSTTAPVTVLRDVGGQWTQILGPESGSASALEEHVVVNSIAPEPGTGGAWLALDTPSDNEGPRAFATLARVAADGSIETQTLPSAAEVSEGIGPKGAAKRVVCPAFNDCWMTTTQGWIFHLAPEGERQLPEAAIDRSQAFSKLITFRPVDAGLPQVTPDAPPADDSGERPAQAAKSSLIALPEVPETKVREPLLSNLHSRLVKGTTTLELSFHLAVKARVKLVAKRKKAVVASTPMRTFARGNRKLRLPLNRRKWPTKLDLQTHALQALPLVSTRLPGNNTVGTQIASLPGVDTLGRSDSLAKLFEGSLP
ncbi:MAG TPA: hypothetical protein VK774_04410 [Solirubrobacteraceae bacterium]|nr:hypothetical protein [Solirubrobacteraceae bacterium]